jgi:hypothetical protein
VLVRPLQCRSVGGHRRCLFIKKSNYVLVIALTELYSGLLFACNLDDLNVESLAKMEGNRNHWSKAIVKFNQVNSILIRFQGLQIIL